MTLKEAINIYKILLDEVIEEYKIGCYVEFKPTEEEVEAFTLIYKTVIIGLKNEDFNL